jgi:hypothetical protein
MMECNCGGYYPVPTCPVCMPSKFYKHYADALAVASEKYLQALKDIDGVMDGDITSTLSAYANIDLADIELTSAIDNYREATK